MLLLWQHFYGVTPTFEIWHAYEIVLGLNDSIQYTQVC